MMFSVKFWTEKLSEQSSFVCLPSGHIDLANQPGESRVSSQKIQELLQRLRSKGSLSFVLDCLKELKGYKIYVVPDPFLHNLTRLFEQAQKKITRTEDDAVSYGRKRLLSLPPPEPSVKQKLSSSCSLTQAYRLEKESADLLREIAWDLMEQLALQGLGRVFNYRECCQLVKPDVMFKIGDRSFPAHRSLLCYYPYWANLFQSNMAEASTGAISIQDIEPEDFERLLEWLYSGGLEWEIMPPAGSSEAVMRCALITNLAMLERMGSIASQYQLGSLETLAAQLQILLGRGMAKPQSALALQNNLTNEFDKPAFNPLFHDVHFQIDHKLCSGNKMVLYRRPYFRLLLDLNKDLQKGTADNPIVVNCEGIQPHVFSSWIHQIHQKGYAPWSKSTEIFPFGYTNNPFPRERLIYPNLNEENVVSILKLADLEMDFDIKKECCEFIFKNGLLPKLSEREAALFDALIIDVEHKNVQEICANAHVKLRFLTIDSAVDLSPDIKKLLQAHGRGLRELVVGSCDWVDDDFIACLVNSCPQLQRLSMDSCAKVTDIGINKIAESCPQLQALILHGICSDAALVAVAKGCPQLRILGLMDTDVSDAGLLEVAKGCPQLQSLELDRTQVSNVGVLKNCTQLRNLVLCSCLKITDAAILELAQGCLRLESLDLTGCTGVTDASISFIAQSWPKMKCLDLDATGITQKCIDALPKHFQSR